MTDSSSGQPGDPRGRLPGQVQQGSFGESSPVPSEQSALGESGSITDNGAVFSSSLRSSERGVGGESTQPLSGEVLSSSSLPSGSGVGGECTKPHVSQESTVGPKQNAGPSSAQSYRSPSDQMELEDDGFTTVGNSKAGRRKARDSAGRRAQRDAREKAHNEEIKKIRLALWPSPEAERSLLKKISDEKIDYRRLRDCVKWNDLWHTFQKAKTPTTKMRDELRKLAADILKKPSRKSSKRSNTGETHTSHKKIELHHFKNDHTYATAGVKRKLSTTSISSLDSAPAASAPTAGSSSRPEAKRTRPGPSTSSSATGTAPRSTQSEDEERIEDEILGEEDEPPLDAFVEQMTAALPYSGAVTGSPKGGKKKNFSKFFLYIHQGTEARCTISKSVWKVFDEKFQALLIDDTLKDKETPNILWMTWKKGVGMIMPTDQRSQELAKAAVDKIEVVGTKFRAWAPGDKGKYELISVRLPQKFSSLPSGKLLTAMEKKNNIPGTKWKLASTSTTPSGEKVMKIHVESEVLELLAGLDGFVFLAGAQLEVHKDGVKLNNPPKH